MATKFDLNCHTKYKCININYLKFLIFKIWDTYILFHLIMFQTYSIENELLIKHLIGIINSASHIDHALICKSLSGDVLLSAAGHQSLLWHILTSQDSCHIMMIICTLTQYKEDPNLFRIQIQDNTSYKVILMMRSLYEPLKYYLK